MNAVLIRVWHAWSLIGPCRLLRGRAPLKEFNSTLRIAAIVGVALYAVYSFLVQSKDQKEIYSAEKEAEKFESQARKERRRGDELQEANLTLQADLAAAKKEAEALNARVAELEATLAEKG